jgi:hypothetical protein
MGCDPGICEIMQKGCTDKYTGSNLLMEEKFPYKIIALNLDKNWVEDVCI